MDNLSRTREDLKQMSNDYLIALKEELEAIGTKKLLQLDDLEGENVKIMSCLRNLKYVSKEIKQAQRVEKAKQTQAQKEEKLKKEEEKILRKEALEAKKLKREQQRSAKMLEIPEILNQRSQNAGVQAIRDAIKAAWLDSKLGLLRKHLESAKQLNTDSGLLDEEIKFCEKEIESLYNFKVNKFQEQISEDSEKINLRLFIYERELNNNPQEKSIVLLGKVKGDPTQNKAIAIISKTEFTNDQVKNFSKIKQFEQEEYFHNSIFRKYWVKLGDATNQLQCNFIYPATEMLIAKYTRQQVYSIRESAEVYNKVTKQYISTLDSAHVEWMHNVLDNKKETELCVFENDHFKLQKDYKFNEGELKTLYCLAIPKVAQTQKLFTVRDLTDAHLPLLKNIAAESYQAIETKFGVPKHKIYAYFHYLPTYYLLHVHFVHVDRIRDDAREQVALETVINNLELNKNYYQQCTLHYSLGDQNGLCKAMIEAGVITEYEEPVVEVAVPEVKKESVERTLIETVQVGDKEKSDEEK